jgi:hypothetical protein
MWIRDLSWKARRYSHSAVAANRQAVLRRNEAESQPVSRVLSRTAIPLGSASPQTSSGLPGSTRGHALQSFEGLRLPYLALLQVGFAMPSVLPSTRCALTAPFHPYQHRFRCFGGLLSVALSVSSRSPGVTWHPARRARTFLHTAVRQRSGCPADSPPGHHTGFKARPQPR